MNLDERRIREEIEHHLEELEARLRAEGMGPAAARDEARRRFGDPDRVQRAARETAEGANGWRRFLDATRLDLAFAFRQLMREPLVTGLTLATLVVGVVATAVVYSVVHAVVIDALPFHEPERLVHVSQTTPQGREYSISEPNFVDFERRQRSFGAMAAMGHATPVLTWDGVDAEAVEGLRVSHDFFQLHGIAPALGRDFLPEEDVFGGATAVAMVSERAWERRFGSDPDIVDRSLELDGVLHRVVGVVPSDEGWPGVEVFTPLAPNPDVYRDDQRLEAFARLLPGMTLAQARADLSEVAAQLSVEYPESNDRWGAAVTPLREALVGARLTRLGWLLLAAVGLFLLMACASVSNLLLARATSRLQEMSVRSALGAGRSRIATQLVTEGAVLAFLGGGLGVLLSRPVLGLVQRLGPSDLARLGEASVSGPVLMVATLAAMGAVMLAGAAPALLLLRGGAFSALRSGSKQVSAPGRRLRAGLVVAQYALAVTVLLSAGLLTRSFIELQGVELGFETDEVARFSLRLADGQYDQAMREDFLEVLFEDLRGLPGVRAVGATTASPFSRFAPGNFVARSDQEPDRQEDFLPVSWRAVTEGYFEAVGIPLVAGRPFDARDRRRPGEDVTHPPVVIDEALAGALWPDGANPVGELVTWFLPGGQQCEIIGVVASARDERIDGRVRPRIYRPYGFTWWEEPTVLVRADSPAGLVPSFRRAVAALDPGVPAISPGLLAEDVRASIAWPRFTMQLFTVFGLIALALAAMGVYGVSAYSVARRRREIGVRVALGAEPSEVRWLVVRGAMRFALLGVLAGVLASIAAAGLLASLLYDVSATDPVTFVAVPAFLVGIALAAAWVPARRAVTLDPGSALAAE